MRGYDDLNFINYGDVTGSVISTTDREFGYYGIQFVHAGRCYLGRDASEPETLEAPLLFFTGPGRRYSYGSPPGEPRGHAYVCFDGARAERYRADGLLNFRDDAPYLRLFDPEQPLQALRRVIHLLGRPGEICHARAVLALEDLLLQLSEQPSLPPDLYHLYGAKLKKLSDRLAAHPEADWDFEQTAAELNLSYSHFRRLFRRIHGWSPGQFLLECRIRRAEKLLSEAMLRISEVAEACGFQDEFHFSRIFKKHRNLSPSAWRAACNR